MNKHPSERRAAHIGARGIGLAAASMAVMSATSYKMSELNNSPAIKARELLHTFNKRCETHLGPHELDADQRESAESLARECQRAGFNYGLEAAIEYARGVMEDQAQMIERLKSQKPTEFTRKEIARLAERRDLMHGTTLRLEEKKFKDVT